MEWVRAIRLGTVAPGLWHEASHVPLLPKPPTAQKLREKRTKNCTHPELKEKKEKPWMHNFVDEIFLTQPWLKTKDTVEGASKGLELKMRWLLCSSVSVGSLNVFSFPF